MFPAESYVDEALRIGLLYGRTAYDSLYVAVAANLNATLVTVDEKPANALAGSFPVKWLSAI